MKTNTILLIAIFVVGVLAAMPMGVSAQNPTATEIKPPSTVVRKVPPGSVVLGPGSHSENIKALTVKRQFDINKLRANPLITLGKAKVNLTSVFKNPMALPNISARLLAMPQLAEVINDHTQVVEVEQGLILHHFLSYRIKPGVCADQARRSTLLSSGIHCASKLTDEARATAFSTRGDAHYIADPARRAIAIAEAKKRSVAIRQDFASDLAKLRASLGNPADRAKIDTMRGAGESARLSKLSDEELESEVANSGVNRIEQVIFVPNADKLDLTNNKPKTGPPPIRITPTPVTAEKPLAQKIFLTGFTLGRDYEWSQRVSISINRCIIGCEKTYYVEAYAGFGYGFGLRFPIRMNGKYNYDRSSGKEKATVTTNFVPFDGSADDYAKTGLASDKIFEGKELVAQFDAHAGFRYDLPIIPNGGVDFPYKMDFTSYLPGRLHDGQFTPPAPGQSTPGTPIIFDEIDLIGGRANFGFAGAQVFPAVEVSLHSDALQFTLHDNNKQDDPNTKKNEAETSLTSSGQTTTLAINPKDHSSSFSIGHPVYNMGFLVTPGIDARLFVDVGLWSHYWDWPVWFPQLQIELPPSGIDFTCHDGTFCSAQYAFAPQPNSKDTNGKEGDTSHNKEKPPNDHIAVNGVLTRGDRGSCLPITHTHSRSSQTAI